MRWEWNITLSADEVASGKWADRVGDASLGTINVTVCQTETETTRTGANSTNTTGGGARRRLSAETC